MNVIRSVCVTVFLAIAAVSLALVDCAHACETKPDLHVEVTSRFDPPIIRNDYSLADIVTLARQQHQDTDRTLLGFYTGEFGFAIDLTREGDPDCPTQIKAVVTLRLQRRLIEISREAAASPCIYPSVLQHYRRLAEVDEQVVERFGVRATAMLARSDLAPERIFVPHADDLNAALRDRISAIVEAAIAPLHGARQDAQQAVNHSGELGPLASFCLI